MDNPQPSHDDIVYLAGLFDGEGCVMIRRSRSRAHRRLNDTYDLRTFIANTYLPIIEWLQETFGGALEIHRPPNPAWKLHYRWCPSPRLAYHVLGLIEPYSRIKRQQICIAREFQFRLMTDRHSRGWRAPIDPAELAWRQAQKERLEALNHRGPGPDKESSISND